MSELPLAGPDRGTVRDEAFDIAKGIGIIAVVGLHVSGRSATLFHKPFDTGWWALTWLNRFFSFCVPLFLLISAVILSRNEAAKVTPDWKRFAMKRARSVVYPLIVWSLLYWLMRGVVQHDPKVLKPGYWTAIGARSMDLAFGKAEFHLYFLSVLAQLCLLLPFCLLFFKRVKLEFPAVLALTVVLQALAFAIQKVVVFAYPGSTIFWYLSTVIPGIWVGMNWSAWTRLRGWTWPVWVFFSLAGFAAFGYGSWQELMHLKSNGTLTNAGSAAYALGMPFLILALITVWSGLPNREEPGDTSLRISDWLRILFRRLGQLSIQVYLMHLITLEVLSKPKIVEAFKALPLPSLWFFLTTLVGTCSVAIALDWVPYANQVLFGRELRRKSAAS